ncbi:MAG TPA: hypothetical protein ENI22_00950 [Candidatus Pacearchaeota archaeon]|nr:hypothetical protein [Candidatus Pacearchaeota archaeon]
MKKNKKGNILTGNIIFIVLNLVFLSILILFLFTKMGGSAVLEEKYAKQIALIVDSAKPGMIIHLNMEDAIETALDEGRNLNEVVLIHDNIITVQLGEKGGYSYSFFNDVQVDANLDTTNSKEYFFVINKK